MAEPVDAEFPGLFCHRTRSDWGVSVLSGERDGNRRYLFEGGEERTMAAAHHHLMQKVEHPDRDQQATYARLMALLAKRDGREAPAAAQGTKALIEQLQRLRTKFPGGFASEAWRSEERNLRVRRARESSVQQTLSAKSLDGLARSNKLDGVWNQAVGLIRESGLVPEEFGTTSSIEHQRSLGEALRDLLHGSDHYERRFDRFVMAYEAVFQKFPSWQVATALSALVWPVEHVCVEPTAFRNQLKALSRQSTLAARPSGGTYARCRSMARALATALAAQGEVPADLLEVHAFIRATVEPSRRVPS